MSNYETTSSETTEIEQQTLERRFSWSDYFFATQEKIEKPEIPRPEIPRIVLSAYAAIAVILALLSTIELFAIPLINFSIGVPAELIIPSYIYLYAIFGTTAYIFANKIGRSDTLRPRQAFYRVFAVLPTAAGVYLLWSMLWPGISKTEVAIAGVAFLTGLFVEVFLRALETLTDKLAPVASTSEKSEPTELGVDESVETNDRDPSETSAEKGATP